MNDELEMAKDVERSDSGLVYGTILAFNWRER
jgi:hypothetical protein